MALAIFFFFLQIDPSLSEASGNLTPYGPDKAKAGKPVLSLDLNFRMLF